MTLRYIIKFDEIKSFRIVTILKVTNYDVRNKNYPKNFRAEVYAPGRDKIPPKK